MSMKRAARRRIDVSRLSNLTARPGMDTRYNLVLAVIDKVVVDPNEGVFADISFFPREEAETALLGVPYAGNGFGFYFPLYQDDVVLVGVPDGDVSAGPVIISRMWSAADKPNQEVRTSTPVSGAPGMYEPSDDVVLRARAGAHTKIIVSDGANVTITVEGAGSINLKIDGGSVNLGSESLVATDGVVQGRAIDAFTGLTQFALGNASGKVFAKKT